MSVLEIIPLTKLQKCANDDLFINVVTIIKSVESALCLKEGGDEEPSAAPTYDIFNETACYLAALKNIGMTQNNIKEIT